MEVVLGIDLGLSGALARLEDGRVAEVHDLPTLRRGDSRRREHDLVAAWDLVRKQVEVGGPGRCMAALEWLHPMPVRVGTPNHTWLESLLSRATDARSVQVLEQELERGAAGGPARSGAIANHALGEAKGAYAMACVAAGIEVVRVSARSWKAYFQLPPGKDYARLKARTLFPEAHDWLERKADHNRADAMLIAEYARQRRGFA